MTQRRTGQQAKGPPAETIGRISLRSPRFDLDRRIEADRSETDRRRSAALPI
jgi:hypothetical protein